MGSKRVSFDVIYCLVVKQSAEQRNHFQQQSKTTSTPVMKDFTYPDWSFNISVLLGFRTAENSTDFTCTQYYFSLQRRHLKTGFSHNVCCLFDMFFNLAWQLAHCFFHIHFPIYFASTLMSIHSLSLLKLNAKADDHTWKLSVKKKKRLMWFQFYINF